MWGTGPSAEPPARSGAGERRVVAIRSSGSGSPGCTSSRRCSGSAGCARLSARLKGKTPGVEASIQKIMGDEHGQHVHGAREARRRAPTACSPDQDRPARCPAAARRGATEVNFPRGESGQYPDVDPIWHYGYLFSPALTVGGGTFAVQRNIIAEQVLGLPRDINVEQGLTWSESRTRTQDA